MSSKIILRMTAAILFTLLFSIYLFFAVASLWMLYILSFLPSDSSMTSEDWIILYSMFPAILVISSICAFTSWLSLKTNEIKTWYLWPTYLFLPLSIPYIVIKSKIENDNEPFEINDRTFSRILLWMISIFNYILSLPISMLGWVLLLRASYLEPVTLFLSIPMVIISLFIFIGTTANIINVFSKSSTANKLSYLGFVLIWAYKIYQISLRKNNLISKPQIQKIKVS